MGLGRQASDETRERARRLQGVLDPAFANRQWSVLDAGGNGRMRDVMRSYEQIRLTEQLLAEQQETNRLLRAIGADLRTGQDPAH